jgi:glutaredoxin-like protein
MPYLDQKIQKQVTEFFADLQDPVVLQLFPGPNEEYAQVFLDIAHEVAALTPLFTVEEINDQPVLEPGHDATRPFTGPVGMLINSQGSFTGIRYLGIPSGLEFGTFLEDILSVSTHHVTLSDKTQESLQALQEPLHIQVFTTPTCRWCPRVARMAHEMALTNPKITADLIDSGEFDTLASHYNVSGVPKSLFNGSHEVMGAVAEHEYLTALLQAAQA